MPRRRRHIRWDRILIVAIPLILLILLCSRCGKYEPEPKEPAAETTAAVVQDTTAPAQPAIVEDTFIVVLDPGHGGKDDGSTNRDKTRFEKNDNLNLALATRDALQKYPKVTVLMTREDDSFPSLDERCEFANQANADLFISLHRNAASEGNGVEIWVNSGDENDMDTLLAEYIMELLESKGISRNRGIRKGFRGESSNNDAEGGYYVNRHTNMPSCLVELGFMSSDIDNQNFDNKLIDYSEAIARAVVELGSDNGLYHEPLPN